MAAAAALKFSTFFVETKLTSTIFYHRLSHALSAVGCSTWQYLRPSQERRTFFVSTFRTNSNHLQNNDPSKNTQKSILYQDEDRNDAQMNERVAPEKQVDESSSTLPNAGGSTLPAFCCVARPRARSFWIVQGRVTGCRVPRPWPSIPCWSTTQDQFLFLIYIFMRRKIKSKTVASRSTIRIYDNTQVVTGDN